MSKKYLGKRKMHEILSKFILVNCKMKDCRYEQFQGDECLKFNYSIDQDKNKIFYESSLLVKNLSSGGHAFCMSNIIHTSDEQGQPHIREESKLFRLDF
jgi:hypothetical protein